MPSHCPCDCACRCSKAVKSIEDIEKRDGKSRISTILQNYDELIADPAVKAVLDAAEAKRRTRLDREAKKREEREAKAKRKKAAALRREADKLEKAASLNKGRTGKK